MIPRKDTVFLAPMAGVTDHIFRQICIIHGANWCETEMISSKALVYEQKSKKDTECFHSKTAPLAKITKENCPISLQLFGSEPEIMAEAAHMIMTCSYKGCLTSNVPDAIDINCGCPMPKITGNGEGSALMKKQDLAFDIVKSIKKVVKCPVSVKMRIGWDDEHINAIEFAQAMEEAGADWIIVHGRTREQMYAGHADYKIIADVKNNVSIPVVANGDIFGGNDAKKIQEITECDAIMVGRGALGNPWIFEEIKACRNHCSFLQPTLQDKIDTAIYHVKQIISEYGEVKGLAESKKHLAWYTHGLRDSCAIRNDIMKSNSFEEVIQLLNSLPNCNIKEQGPI